MNKVLLLGRLVKDIEIRYSQNNVAYTSFVIAVNRRFKKEGQQEADFISCKSLGKTAEFLGKYFSKGSQILIEGNIQTGSYDKEGQKIYTTDIFVETVEFADTKRNKVETEKLDSLFLDDELPFK